MINKGYAKAAILSVNYKCLLLKKCLLLDGKIFLSASVCLLIATSIKRKPRFAAGLCFSNGLG